MQRCPKCGYERKFWQLSQYCPGCKTNLMFYGFEDRFYEDAKKAEMSLAGVRMKVARVKAGLIGGMLPILRFASVLPVILALLIPFGSVTLSTSIYERKLSFGGIGLYTVMTDGMFSLLEQLSDGEILGPSAAQIKTVYMAELVLIAIAAVLLVCTVLSFISFKKMAVILCVVCVGGIGATTVTAILFSHILSLENLLTVKSGPAVFAASAAFALCFFLNLQIARKGLPISYRPGDPERVATSKRYKRHELTLEEIPFPIFQTEEERAAREQAIQETSEKLRQAQKETDKNE